ncbi:Cys-tRNA(Pro) deacylase [Pseudodesulfovibrio cashew]|uniref:Cys-tRNA(Pro)/Cys-tRNA(Cys) deacylase n=1 Tax=Pseudodesulfovibrio cashew TaxID=2678688 RepID=A0A6I6JC07_9BACT|nr:Cys-tRNA(Pro) deacylase [Pseudodesulfovibrio cashew]QGY40315.1 Cys-tRNA(Pro) deacylase [Pseudodesulfovibrio cashew]
MTPAIKAAKKAKIDFTVREYEHDPAAESYGVEAAEKLGVAPVRVFKTLVADCGGNRLAVAVVPVMQRLDLKLLAKAVGVKKAAMAEVKTVERVTGYVVGGVSPLGQKKRLDTVIDASAEDLETVFVSAGRRGLDIELSPQDLARLTRGGFAPVAR